MYFDFSRKIERFSARSENFETKTSRPANCNNNGASFTVPRRTTDLKLHQRLKRKSIVTKKNVSAFISYEVYLPDLLLYFVNKA